MVFGFFLDGKGSQVPMVLGSVPRRETLPSNGNFLLNQGLSAQNLGETTSAIGQRVTTSWTTPLIEGSNAEIAFVKQYYEAKRNPYAAQIAAGFVGNFINESTSSLNPKAVGDNGNSFGIAQWNRGSGRYTTIDSGPLGLLEFSSTKQLPSPWDYPGSW